MAPDYPVCRECIPDVSHVRSEKYTARFAASREELQDVLRLRFEVFKVELGADPFHDLTTGVDEDIFDPFCHHLVIREKTSGTAVGTYRMQTAVMAEQGEGFYTDREFDLSGAPRNLFADAVELGRACILPAHRKGKVLFLLWRGLLAYLQHNRLNSFFGCCSLLSRDPGKAWALYAHLNRTGALHPDLHLRPRPPFRCPDVPWDTEKFHEVLLPRLMNLYLSYGADICSEPAIDREFNTVDYVALLDIRSLSASHRKLFYEEKL